MLEIAHNCACNNSDTNGNRHCTFSVPSLSGVTQDSRRLVLAQQLASISRLNEAENNVTSHSPLWHVYYRFGALSPLDQDVPLLRLQ